MDLPKLLLSCYVDWSKLLHGFVKNDTCISQNYFGFVEIDTWIYLCCYMDLSKLLYGFVKLVTWICPGCSIYYLASTFGMSPCQALKTTIIVKE